MIVYNSLFKIIAMIPCLILFLSCTLNEAFALSSFMKKFSPEELPNIIISYNLSVSYYNDFSCLWQLNERSHFFSKLHSEFESLSCNIDTRMSFTHLAFISQNNIEGHFSGLIPKQANKIKEPKVPHENILFVTTPIESLGNSILVLLSSVSPERTTVMSIDNMLNVNLLYDSYEEKLPYKIICSISSILVIKPGIFKLEERKSGRCSPSDLKRNILIDVSSGDFKIFVENNGYGRNANRLAPPAQIFRKYPESRD
jgi:hypothetical protein